MAITDTDGNVLESRHFDAWGTLTHGEIKLLDRGYTSHEHLQDVGLIHMNGRLYDPLMRRFLNADQNIQDPYNTQCYNKYGYVLNNPLMFNDPSGEFFLGTLITAITNGIQNVIKHGVNVQNYNWKELNNAWKIDIGQFKGNFAQILNNLTWGFVNNTIGNLVAHGYNLAGQVDGVTHLGGATAIETKRSSTEAFTLGSYINGPKGFKADWRDHLFVHEYGHYVQSQWFGPLYIPIVATTSVASTLGVGCDDHRTRWFEVQASRMGAEYFDKRYGSGPDGYTQNSVDYFDYRSFSIGGFSPYNNPRYGTRFQGSAHPTSGARFS